MFHQIYLRSTPRLMLCIGIVLPNSKRGLWPRVVQNSFFFLYLRGECKRYTVVQKGRFKKAPTTVVSHRRYIRSFAVGCQNVENVETRCSRLRCPGGKVGLMPLCGAPVFRPWRRRNVMAGMRCWVGDASIASLPECGAVWRREHRVSTIVGNVGDV